MKNSRNPATIAAQAGGFIDKQSGGVVPPVQPSTTYVRDETYQPLNQNNIYGRDHNDQVRLAERVIAELEGGETAMLFPSGMAAIAALFRTLESGSSVVMQSGIYWGTTQWVRGFCTRRSINLSEVDASCGDKLAAACHDHKPAIVFVETPSNPWLKITDIAHAADCAHKAGALLVVDSTAATPVLSHPLEMGANIVMHSATKAINGHSDVLAGVLITNDQNSEVWEAIAKDRHDAGAILGAYEASLLIRGMRTLPLRVERMCENAMAVAEYLKGHRGVEEVLYPGLGGHKGHHLAARQMHGGYGCLLSALVKGRREDALGVAGRLRLFHRATSLGGVESLVEHRHTIEPNTGIPPNLLRFSIGIENVDDLIGDLEQALAPVIDG